MIEEVLSGRNGSAQAVRAAARTLTQTVARAVRHMTCIEVVCEVSA